MWMCSQANGCACGATCKLCANRWDSGARATGLWIGRPDGQCCRRRIVTASGCVSSRPDSRTGTRVRCAKKEDNSCSCKGWRPPLSLLPSRSLISPIPPRLATVSLHFLTPDGWHAGGRIYLSLITRTTLRTMIMIRIVSLVCRTATNVISQKTSMKIYYLHSRRPTTSQSLSGD